MAENVANFDIVDFYKKTKMWNTIVVRCKYANKKLVIMRIVHDI